MAPNTTPRSFTVALPIVDRRASHGFYCEGLGWEAFGEPADDGVPEPLQLRIADGVVVMFVPIGGFGWVTAPHRTAEPGVSECLLSIDVEHPDDVVALVERARRAGASVTAEPAQQPWGFTGTFADPDGHLWSVVAP